MLIIFVVLADLSIKHVPKLYVTMRESPYVGRPSLKIDRAWQNLMSNMSIRVTKEELNRNQQTSVQLPQGGYLAWLGAFHQLHCTVSKASHLVLR